MSVYDAKQLFRYVRFIPVIKYVEMRVSFPKLKIR